MQAAIEKPDGEAWCGLLVVDLRRGDIVEWIKLDGYVGELFDVAALSDGRRPMSIVRGYAYGPRPDAHGRWTKPHQRP